MEKRAVAFELKDVVSAYIGKANACMCGCSGNYVYNELNREYASRDRGYAVDDEDVNERALMMRLKKFNKIEDLPENIDDYILTKFYGNDRQITVYLKQKK